MHILSRSTGPLLSPPHHGRYAVGVTLLICLTNRHPEGIFHACETEHDEDFEEVAASKLADPSAGFPAAVAGKLRDIVKCNGKCLCHDKERKRLDLPSVLEAMHEILSPTAGPLDDALPPSASAESPGLSQPSTTVLLSQIGREAVANKQEEAERRLQRHAVNGFNDFMRMLERSYGTAAPELTACDQVRCACQPPNSQQALELPRPFGLRAGSSTTIVTTRGCPRHCTTGCTGCACGAMLRSTANPKSGAAKARRAIPSSTVWWSESRWRSSSSRTERRHRRPLNCCRVCSCVNAVIMN